MAEPIKYEKEIREFYSDIFKSEYLSDEEWEEALNEVFNTPGYSIEEISQRIEVGVKNGYSLGFQFNLVKLLLGDDEKKK